jgi:hypothetical protein
MGKYRKRKSKSSKMAASKKVKPADSKRGGDQSKSDAASSKSLEPFPEYDDSMFQPELDDTNSTQERNQNFLLGYQAVNPALNFHGPENGVQRLNGYQDEHTSPRRQFLRPFHALRGTGDQLGNNWLLNRDGAPVTEYSGQRRHEIDFLGSQHASQSYNSFVSVQPPSWAWNYGVLGARTITNYPPEHVLKPSASNSGLMLNSENVRLSTAAKAAPAGATRNATLNTGAVKKPSPTPSIKRTKAHKLLEAHGSPPTFRVTAGGHVVFNDISLGSPRYPPGLHQRGKYQFNNPGGTNPPPALIPPGFVAYAISPSGEKHLCQWVGGQFLPLPYGPHGPLLYVSAPNYPFPTVPGSVPGFFNVPQMPTFPPSQLSAVPNGPPSAIAAGVDAQIQYLRERYATLERVKLEHERKEVHIKDELPHHERAQMVDRKRHLINELDGVRKMIKNLESQKQSDNDLTARTNMFPSQTQGGYVPSTAFANVPPSTWGYPPGSAGMFAPPYPYVPCNSENVPQNIGLPNFASSVYRTFEEPVLPHAYVGEKPTTNSSNYKDGAASALALDGQSPTNTEKAAQADVKRSHAIEIKDPWNSNAVAGKLVSKLDPTSPEYEPGKAISPKSGEAQSPSPGASNGGQKLQLRSPSPIPAASNVNRSGYLYSPRPEGNSEASYTTTDFFPNDAHEHSLKKYQACNASSTEGDSTVTVSYARKDPTTPGRFDQFQNVGYPYGTVLPSPNSPLELAQPKVPQPSPVDDYRLSSFLRDVNANLEPPKRRSGNWGSEVEYTSGPQLRHEMLQFRQCDDDGLRSTTGDALADTTKNIPSQNANEPKSPRQFNSRLQSHEDNQEYMDGLFAGLAGSAPHSNRSQAYIDGYIAGLLKKNSGQRKSSRSMSTVSQKSEHVTPTQPPNTAVSSLHEVGGSIANSRLTTEDPSMLSASRDNENVRLASRSPAAYTPTKQSGYGPSPHVVKMPSAVSASLRMPLPQRVFSGSFDVEARHRAFFQRDSDDTQEGTFSASPPLEGLGAAPSLLTTAPLTERSNGNETSAVKSPGHHYASKDIEMAPNAQHAKDASRSKTRSAPTQMSMDGAVDDLAGLTMPGSPCAESSKQPPAYKKPIAGMKSPPMSNATTAIGSPIMTPPSSGTPPSKTAGCSPKRFSPSKAKATLHSFLHSGSSKEGKGTRSPSPEPALDSTNRRQWKQNWAAVFAKMKADDKAEKGESPDVAEYKRRNPLPDRLN